MPRLHRRQLLASAPIALGGLVLPGCTASTARPATAAKPGGCLPPVNVAENRVIRSVVGLRPYRAAGFVVREERLGDTRIVHNYGHGGAGITLSWGTSRLAADLGLKGHQGPVAVIGAGVMGLTTARLVQEAGFPVTLYAAALPPHTTSNVAGGQWSPFGHYREDAVTPEWRAQFAAALDYSWRRYQIMVGDDYGIRWLTTYAEESVPGQDGARDPYHPAGRSLTRSEHPFALEHVESFVTMYVEPGRFLRQLLRDIQLGGAQVAIRSFATPAEIAALPERLAFNCTGLGARSLFGDEALRPARGQLAILLPQPEVTYALNAQAGHMFPRPDGIVLGGTFRLDDWSTEPDPRVEARILASHKAIFGGFRCTA